MNIEGFLAPLDATSPSGIELRNDARFHSIERQLEPASREARLKSVASGGSGAVTLDWSAIIDDARELAASGRDLRLLVIVVRAMANDGGFAGLADGLGMLTRAITQYWDNLHPALRNEASRREAAVRRINALFQLENSDNGLLGDLEFNTVLDPRGLGPVTGGDLAAASLTRIAFLNEAPKGLGDKETAEMVARHDTRVNRVTAACRTTAAERPAELEDMASAIEAARAAMVALEAALDPLVTENAIAVKFGKLAQFLNRVSQTLASVKGAAAAVGGTMMTPEPVLTAPAPTHAATPTPAATGVPTQINSRSEVERCLDLIIDFYKRTEPSSPIPHLAQRMRRMVPMNFLQLIEEVAPGGMKEFRSLAGMLDDKPK